MNWAGREQRVIAVPAVSWVVPNGGNSEHPDSSIAVGQAYVTRLINAVMKGPDWSSSAVFVTYDDCGCFYDHVPPPSRDTGIREPMVIVSPCAKQAYTDHNTAYAGESTLAFIEHTFNLPSSRSDVHDKFGPT